MTANEKIAARIYFQSIRVEVGDMLSHAPYEDDPHYEDIAEQVSEVKTLGELIDILGENLHWDFPSIIALLARAACGSDYHSDSIHKHVETAYDS